MWSIIRAEFACEWLTWSGQPMLFDGGIFVNRSAEEMERTTMLRFKEMYEDSI